jgi:capsular exopolysaccharide synthesis family protein
LRTAILLSSIDKPPKVLMMTSCVPGEGKSTTTFNLATVLAQSGSKVLVIDADLRKGSLSSGVHMSKRQGLAASLLGTHYLKDIICPVAAVPGLDFLPAGTCPPYPAELLVSKKMRELMTVLRAEYDYIVVDTPAMLPVTDAVAMSTQADAVIVIARSGVTQRRALNRSMRMLGRSTTPIIGIVLNCVDVVSPDYYAYSGYTRYGKYYGNEAGDDANSDLASAGKEN